MFKKSPFLYANKLDARVFSFLDLWATAGIDARMVGGCVRDCFVTADCVADESQETCSIDFDIAVACLPEKSLAFCKAHVLHAIPTGIEHGTITVFFRGLKFEVTSLRTDVVTFGRTAQVQFGTSFEEDARRRDFTFNALYVDRHEILYDAFDGVADVKAGVVRFIGNPADRLREDVLRVWRYFRFWGRFGKGMPSFDILPPIQEIKKNLDMLSIERVQMELFKLLSYPDPKEILQSVEAYGLWAASFGASMNLSFFSDLLLAEQNRSQYVDERFMPSICLITRLYALFHGEEGAERLRLSRAERHKLDTFKRLFEHESGFDATSMPHVRKGKDQKDQTKDAQECKDTVRKSTVSADKIRERLVLDFPSYWVDGNLLLHARDPMEPLTPSQQHPLPVFPIQGKDLLQLGIPAGREMGTLLRHLKQAWWLSDFTLSRQACEQLALEKYQLRFVT